MQRVNDAPMHTSDYGPVDMPQLKRHERADPARNQAGLNSYRIADCLGAFEQRVIGDLLRVRHRHIVEAPLPGHIRDLVKALEEAPIGPGQSEERPLRLKA